MVYPGASHSRFEHSLGVYWLAGQTVHSLQTYQGSELDIDHFDRQKVKLAGLLHDVGHGPFSHLFEHEFLPRVRPGSKWSHEQMSIQLMDYIVDENHIDIDTVTLRKVKDMITSSDTAGRKSRQEKPYLFDIVANGRNGIDVDKFDYISRDSRACGLGCNFQFQRLMESMRVMDDEICYPAKEYLTIYKMFATRADLHRTVYTHAKVKAIELMLVDALVKANYHLAISSYISDPAQYWKLDDTIIKNIETSTDVQLKESREIILRIRRRDLYQFCNEYSVPSDKMDHFKDITAQDIVCSQKSSGVTLKEEDVAVSNIQIDLTCGKYNPLESLRLCTHKKKEKEAILVQTLGVVSIYVVIAQLALAGAMPLPQFIVTSVVVSLGLVLNFMNYFGWLQNGIWPLWEDFITVGGLSVLPQVMWSTFVPFVPSSILPGTISCTLALAAVVMARTGKLSEAGTKFVGSVSGWTATLLFMWMPIAQMWTNYLNPDNIKGLSALTLLLGMIGNALMIPRALFIRDLMWFTGASWASILQGWGNLLCMYCLSSINREFFFGATVGLFIWLGCWRRN